MKYLLMIVLMLSYFTVKAAETKYSSGSYHVDAEQSKIGFSVPTLMISTVEGTFTMMEGTIDLNENFENSVVKVKVETKSINTGIDKRDNHLRSADFFNVKKYPYMTFESTNIKGPKERFLLTGKLTIKGVTKVVTFDTYYLGIVSTGFGDDKAAFVGKALIDRKDFNVTWNKDNELGPLIGDQVQIDLRILAMKPSKATAKMFNGVLEYVR